MATARKLPSGKWRCLQYIGMENGERKYKSFTADSKKEAEYAAAEYMVNKKRKADPANMMVGEAIDKYIDNRESVLSPATVREYRLERRNYLQGIMDTKLADLTQEDVQIAINEDAKKKSSKTVRNAHGLLSAALKEYAPDVALRTKLPAKKKPSIDIPDDEAVKLLIKEADQYLRAAIVVGAFGGLRRSEICALERKDIKKKNGSINVDKAIVLGDDKEWVLKDPKSYDSKRVVKVPPFVIDELLALPNVGDKLFPIMPDSVTYRFCELRKRFGHKFRFHDLRHYNASIMLALGIPDKYAMEHMGHSTTNMLKNVYQHTLANKKDEFTGKLNSHFEGIMQHEMQHEGKESE